MKENCRFQSLFFVGLPDLRKLCGITMVLNCDDADAKTLQTITCRELLFLYPEVLTAPGEYKEIIVIMPIVFYKTGNIQAFAQKHRGKMDVPQRVIPAVLQICLSFTLVARLAPDWNKAGRLLIHGKDFLGKEEKQNAVVMELNVSETQLCISVEASTIRLPLAKFEMTPRHEEDLVSESCQCGECTFREPLNRELQDLHPAMMTNVDGEDFDISTGLLKNFCSKKIAVIPKHFIASNWCYVLPSMKKGQIVSISREIPPYCPFKSYGDFQKHWKNMYGYNLPEINSDMALYYTVYFKLIGEKLFTYPFCCIRSEPVQFYPRVNLESVLTSFISDLKIKFPSLCGLPIKVTSKPCYSTNELIVSQTVQTRPPNLTTKPVFRTALTQIPAANIANNKTSSIYSIDGNQKTTVLDNEQKLDIKASSDAESIHGAGLSGSTFRSMEKPEVVFQNLQKGKIQVAKSGTLHQMEVHSGSINHAYRIVPIFKSKLLKKDNFISSRINENKTKQNENSNKLLTLNSSNANIKVKAPRNVQEQECRNEKVDLFDEPQKQNSSNYISVGTPGTSLVQNSSSDSVTNMCKDTLLLKSNTRIIKPGDTALGRFGHFQEHCNRNTQFGNKNAVGPTTFDRTCTKWIDSLMGNQHKQFSGVFDIKKPFKQEKQSHFQNLSSKPMTGRNFSDKGIEKRKCEEKASDSKPKKPKTKPVIQDVDVEKHAKNNQLSKLNSVTLQSWLKCRGVSVRTRDKKEHLVSKIMEFIKGPQNEFGNICPVNALHKVE